MLFALYIVFLHYSIKLGTLIYYTIVMVDKITLLMYYNVKYISLNGGTTYMTIPFFESNQKMLEELRIMDHNTKEYKKTIQKIFIDIGGISNLFEYLKSTEDGERSKKKYFRYLISLVILIVLFFALIIVSAALTSGADTNNLTGFETSVTIGFLILFIAWLVSIFRIAFKAKHILLNGVSYLIDNYNNLASENPEETYTTVDTYVSKRKKTSNKVLIITVAAFIVFFGIIRLSGFAIDYFSDSQKKDFSKAGITITLTQEFVEDENITQTASYYTDEYYVSCLKEDFETLSIYDISSNITLNEYADLIIENNTLDATIEGTDNKPYIIYSETKDDKEYTYLEVLYKSSDAYWAVCFTCYSKDFESSKDKFIKWSDSVTFS